MTVETRSSKLTLGNTEYERILLKTRLISEKDDSFEIIDTYTKKHRLKSDIIVVSERIIAIMQGRSYPLTAIKPGFWAQKLYPFVSSHPGGIGLRSPWTMELAIREAGLLRILLAAFASLITKPFGLKGVFYHVAGNNVNAIDGPCDYTLPPGNTSAKLGPTDPMGTSKKLSQSLGCEVAIIDANDYGVRVMGYSDGIDPHLIGKLFKDNPMGQADEQTPMALVRVVERE